MKKPLLFLSVITMLLFFTNSYSQLPSVKVPTTTKDVEIPSTNMDIEQMKVLFDTPEAQKQIKELLLKDSAMRDKAISYLKSNPKTAEKVVASIKKNPTSMKKVMEYIQSNPELINKAMSYIKSNPDLLKKAMGLIGM